MNTMKTREGYRKAPWNMRILMSPEGLDHLADAAMRCAQRLMPLRVAIAEFSPIGRSLSFDDLMGALHRARARVYLLQAHSATRLQRYRLGATGSQLDFGWFFDEEAKGEDDVKRMREGLLVRPEDAAFALRDAGYELSDSAKELVRKLEARRSAKRILEECCDQMAQDRADAKMSGNYGWKETQCKRPTGEELDILKAAGMTRAAIACELCEWELVEYRRTQSTAGGKNREESGQPVRRLANQLGRRYKKYLEASASPAGQKKH